MSTVHRIADPLVPILSEGSWDVIELNHRKVGLDWRPDLEPGWGKPKYVKRVLADLRDEEIISVARRCVEVFPTSAISVQDALWWHEAGGVAEVSDLTRLRLADALDGRIVSPREAPMDFLRRVAVAKEGTFLPRCAYGESGQLLAQEMPFGELILHGLAAKPGEWRAYSHRDLLDCFGYLGWPDRRLFVFLEAVVHPIVRSGDDQRAWVKLINDILVHDGFHLTPTGDVSGQPVFAVRPGRVGVAGSPRNLVFAANGPKPEIGFSDAVNNDIVILKNREFCLVYDEPVGNGGLLWNDLVSWWSGRFGESNVELDTRKSLGQRLLSSLASPPERRLFEEYFRSFAGSLGDQLPALVPQVYLHYDPVTVRTLRERGESKRFLSQRMDFLLLLKNSVRVVLEVDGKQHYSIDGRPSPSQYANTVYSDRQLRLAGYEVYRFAGCELGTDQAARTVQDFFTRLFNRHRIGTRGG